MSDHAEIAFAVMMWLVGLRTGWVLDDLRRALAVFDTLTEENPAPHGDYPAHEPGGRS